MDQLLKIHQNEGKNVVSARELYDFLEVNTKFTTWCDRMFDYGFEQEIDFFPIMGESTGGRPLSDYALTLDCAKEISMLQRNDKGKMARKYFIEVEKKFKEEYDNLTEAEKMLRHAQMMVEQERKVKEHDKRISVLEAKTKTRPDYFTIAGYGSLVNIPTPTEKAKSLGRRASKLCREKGIDMGSTHDERFGKVKTYPKSVLEEVFNS